jgi:hypothetical protein
MATPCGSVDRAAGRVPAYALDRSHEVQELNNPQPVIEGCVLRHIADPPACGQRIDRHVDPGDADISGRRGQVPGSFLCIDRGGLRVLAGGDLVNELVPFRSSTLPELVAAAGERAGMRFLEFFAANIRNPHTRRAYARAADEFLAWCASAGVPAIGAVQPVHVATWIEAGTRELAAPSVKQRLAAIRHLFDWLVTGQVVPINPAASVRGPRHVVTSG